MVCTGYDLSAGFASRSVVMTVLAMHVLMGNLIFRSSSHIGDLQGEAQGLAGQRVVAVQQHDLALDFGDVKHLLATIAAAAFQLPTYFDARWKLAARDGAHQAFVAQAESIFGLQRKDGLKPGLFAFQRFFDFCQRIAITAMQVNHGVAAFFKELALCIGYLEAQGDGGVFFNFHGGCFRSAFGGLEAEAG